MPLARRDFLKAAGGFSLFAGARNLFAAGAGPVAILPDPADAIATSGPVRWACAQLSDALQERGITARMAQSFAECRGARLIIIAANSPSSVVPGGVFTGISASQPESFDIAAGRLGEADALVIQAPDSLGFVYALLELADRARYAPDALAALSATHPALEHPSNQVRSITRAFVSEVEDKPWYYDKTFWPDYLSMLAAQRFNRFNLAFGIGWDFAREITDDYFHFAYPFLVDVPGYNVRVVPLSARERDLNLETLRFISDETAARGLRFHLGLWTHAYEWHDSPHAAHRVEGLTPQTQAAYCRDALALLLKSCPAIHGLTFRVHGESGVAEGSYDFWRTVFTAIPASGRTIAIDLHAKGLDDRMIDVALETGMPVSVSPKFWAEHMGLGYHQTAIRELEMPPRQGPTRGLFSLSEGSRSFLRYGYGDLLRRDRKYAVVFRLWPGTQRHLLWGDPATAAAYGRSAQFCGAAGMEICEPLFFKGRKGSGLPGGRCAYAARGIAPRNDFEKYLYTYRLWGRLLYNPDADPESWRRFLRTQFYGKAGQVEDVLANAGRVLPLITTAHLPSAANNTYWPEMYTNMPIVEGSSPQIYGDTPRPKRFGTVSPIDPGIFSTVEEYAAELLAGTRTGKYSPVEVAQWLEDFTARAEASLRATSGLSPAGERVSPEEMRFDTDAVIQIGLGRFFASKFRAAALFAIWQKTANRQALEQALAAYRQARDSWSSFMEFARAAYRADITYGPDPNQRGHWQDRLPAIDADIAAMAALLDKAPTNESAAASDSASVAQAILECTGRPQRLAIECSHAPAKSLHPGAALEITLNLPPTGDFSGDVVLHYRHVNQAEDWQTLAATLNAATRAARFTAAIPAAYTASPFALQYYFELRRSPGSAWFYPALGPDLTEQPYFVVPQA